MLGGYSEPKVVDAAIRLLVNKVRSQVELKLNGGVVYNEFEPTTYQHQLVNGNNYLVQVRCDSGVITLLIFESFKNEVSLVSVEMKN